MSSKPSTVPTWATAGTKTAPTSTKRAAGWTAKERPPGQILNWLFGLFGDWFQYLSDGALSGDHSISGTLDVTGHLYQEAIEHVVIGPSSARTPAGSAHALDTNGYAWLAGASSSDKLHWQIELPAGAHIRGWELFFSNNSDSGTMHAQLHAYDTKTGVDSALGSNQSFAAVGSATFNSMSDTSLDVAIAAPGVGGAVYYYVTYTGTGDVTPGKDVVGPLVVAYTIPKP